MPKHILTEFKHNIATQKLNVYKSSTKQPVNLWLSTTRNIKNLSL